VQDEEDQCIESDINIFSLEYMDLEVDIDKLFPPLDHPRNTTHQNPSLEIIENETFNEEESFSFQSTIFDTESKKFITKKSDVKNGIG
jgi:hypothetical protein